MAVGFYLDYLACAPSLRPPPSLAPAINFKDAALPPSPLSTPQKEGKESPHATPTLIHSSSVPTPSPRTVLLQTLADRGEIQTILILLLSGLKPGLGGKSITIHKGSALEDLLSGGSEWQRTVSKPSLSCRGH